MTPVQDADVAASTVGDGMAVPAPCCGPEGVTVLTEDRERWAEALALARLHGDAVPLWIANRLGELALAGGSCGSQALPGDRGRYDRMMSGSVQ